MLLKTERERERWRKTFKELLENNKRETTAGYKREIQESLTRDTRDIVFLKRDESVQVNIYSCSAHSPPTSQ
ncbi:hypothetical protein BgiBS90_036478, partial [Biomphalaria glabrata]